MRDGTMVDRERHGGMSAVIRLRVNAAFSGETLYELEDSVKVGERDVCLLTTDSSLSTGYRNQAVVLVLEKDAAEVAGLLETLMKTPVCVCPPNLMGLDGTTYDMEIIRGFNRVQFTWWGKLPEQWANLAPLVRFMVSGAADPVPGNV